MFLVWGLGFLLMERLSNYLNRHGVMLPIRAVLYMIACIVWEYIFGVTFGFILHRIPWDYSYSAWSIGGATRLDYAPYWLVGGVLMEVFLKLVNRVRIMVGKNNEKNCIRNT
jgi:uncharacterized membrane protein